MNGQASSINFLQKAPDSVSTFAGVVEMILECGRPSRSARSATVEIAGAAALYVTPLNRIKATFMFKIER